MRYMSVCSGVEAASLAWRGLGWEPVAFSEIDPFPCAVLAARFPDVPNLGDMTKIEGEEDGAITNGLCRIEGGIDLLVGGTPCQSFSVAGRREGLKGASGLAYHFVRLLREIQPKWFVWENVPGALSSRTDGQLDFNFLVGAFAECGYGLAWRILDAQYVRSKSFPFAIPQRRRRLFVVGCLGDGESAGKVLFDGESLSGDTPPRREAAQGASAPAAGGPEAPGERGVVSLVPYGMRLGAHEDGVASTIARIDAKFPQCVCKEEEQPREANGFNFELFTGECKEVSPCLGASRAGDTMVYDGEGKPKASWWDGSEKADTLTTTSDAQRMPDPDKGRLQCVMVPAQNPHDSTCVFTKEAHPRNATEGQGWRETDVAKTFDTFCTGESRAEELIVGYDNHPNDSRVTEASGAFACLPSNMGTGGNNTPLVLRTATTPVVSRLMVRRITPVETERLMGFPDNWTRIPWRGKPAEKCPDGPRYKACGNSFCVNCVEWIGMRIQAQEEKIQCGKQ